MLYIINNDICYNSEDCTLKYLPTGDVTKLSITAARLFETILNSDGEILSRDFLLSEVWDNYGLQGSGNNLNQYVSIIRRTLHGWGCNDLIVTIPKNGFALNSNIIIKKVYSNEIIHENKKYNIKHKVSFYLWYLFACVFTFLMIFFSCFISYEDIKSSIRMKKINPNGCDINYLDTDSNNTDSALSEQVLKIIHQNNLACGQGKVFYFTNYKSIENRNLGRTLLSYCDTDDNGIVTTCDNYYYKDWRVE